MTTVEDTVARCVIPGDVVPLNLESESKDEPTVIKIGTGLYQHEGNLITVKAGILKWKTASKVWIDCRQRWYFPALSEPVIGAVVSKHAEFFRVNINSSHVATLSSMAFERAVKKNRPDLDIGDVVYARVSLADKDIDPEIQCVDRDGKNTQGYGPLEGGLIIKCASDICRYLITPGCLLLKELGEMVIFEIAVGLNGYVWVKGTTKTVLFINCVIKEFHKKKTLKFNREKIKQFLLKLAVQ